jgi:molybdenum cofactor biosynthesis protein B
VTTVPEGHRAAAPLGLGCAVLTISDTRSRDDDLGGDELERLLLAAGHHVLDRAISRDEPPQIRSLLQRWVADSRCHAVLLTGGTGLSHRDQTFETVRALLTKDLPGYGELFRWLSFQEIGPAAMLSRALGGLIESTVVLTMPGSPAAVRLAMERIIVPELGHLVQQARK